MENNLINNSTAPKTKWIGSLLKILLTVISLALVAGVCYGAHIFWQSHHLKSLRSGQTTSSTFKTLASYSLPGLRSGSGMKFSAPEGLTEVKASPVSPIQVKLLKKSATGDTTAAVTALSLYLGSGLNAEQRSNLVKSLSGVAYNNVQPASDKDFVPESFGLRKLFTAGYTVTSGKPLAFKSANITTNSWQWDFNVTVNDPKSTKPSLEGKAIVAVGDNAIYYYLAYSSTYNWAHNLSIWQQSFNSIKIDQ